MDALLNSVTFLLIILVGYLLKRWHLVQPRDYKVLQAIAFDLTLPSAIIVSFVLNPHSPSLFLVTLVGFVAALLPIPLIALTSRHRPVAERAFLLLTSSGYNIGNFCFPVLQTFLGTGSLVYASMFDMGNSVMVTAGTNVMTTSLLRIDMDRSLSEQYQGDAPTVPYERPTDPDARRMARNKKIRKVIRGFLFSPAFDVYLVMIVVTIFAIHLPSWLATVFGPIASANPFVSLVMVGMLMDFPQSSKDVKQVARVLSWRLPIAVILSVLVWFFLPFDGLVRKALVMLLFAPTATFSTLFTDRVLGNPKLAGFTLATSALIAIVIMTVLNIMLPA